MIEIALLILCFAAGLGLGLIFFGGLWLTVRWLPKARWPALLFLASLLGRTAVTMVGLYLVMGGRWQRLLAAVIGFTLMRFVLVYWLRSKDAKEAPAHEELS